MSTQTRHGYHNVTYISQLFLIKEKKYQPFWPHQWQCSNFPQGLQFQFQSSGSLCQVGVWLVLIQHRVCFYLAQSIPVSTTCILYNAIKYATVLKV